MPSRVFHREQPLTGVQPCQLLPYHIHLFVHGAQSLCELVANVVAFAHAVTSCGTSFPPRGTSAADALASKSAKSFSPSSSNVHERPLSRVSRSYTLAVSLAS